MHPLWTHVEVRIKAGQQTTIDELTSIFRQYGQVLFISPTEDGLYWIQMRWPKEAYQAMYQVNLRHADKFEASVQFYQKNALWFGNLPYPVRNEEVKPEAETKESSQDVRSLRRQQKNFWTDEERYFFGEISFDTHYTRTQSGCARHICQPR